jgi:hypothetical protein
MAVLWTVAGRRVVDEPARHGQQRSCRVARCALISWLFDESVDCGPGL